MKPLSFMLIAGEASPVVPVESKLYALCRQV